MYFFFFFFQIGEAFEVLSDKNKRAIYDKYGEEGLKMGGGGEPSSGNGGGGPGVTFTSTSMPGGMRFSSSDPSKIFASFFGTSDPFAAFEGGGFGGGGGGSGGGIRMGTGMGNGFPGMSAGGGGGGRRGPMTAEPIKRTLMLSLEELYTGTTKKVKVTRERLIPGKGGRATEPQEKILEIQIKPGWKAGTAITFEKEGDEVPGGPAPADLVFVIGEKKHDQFTREGSNLIKEVRLSLVDALTGTTLTVTTLDGRTIPVAITEVISPGSIKTIRGEGMPNSKGGPKGDLILKFEIQFPRTLTDEKKRQLRTLL